RPPFPGGADRAEEEGLVLHDRTAAFRAGIAHARALGVDRAVRRRNLLPRALGLRRARIAEHRAAEVVGAALRHHVDDTAGGLAELRLVAAGFHLDFLHEIERCRVAERSEDDRIRAEGTVALVRHVDAVDHVLVLEAAAARN